MSTSGAETSGLTSVSAADNTIIAEGSNAVTLRANVGTAAGTVAAGNDPRFGEIAGVQITGAPVAGQVPIASSATAAAWGTPAGGGSGVTSVAAANSTITVSGTATAPTLSANVGTASGTVAAGNDSRFGVVASAGISDATTVGKAVLTADDAAAARAATGAGTSNLALGTTPTTALAGDTTPNDIGAPDNTGPVSILHLWSGTSAQYAAIATKDPNTLYVVNG